MIYEYNANVSGIDNKMKMLMGTKIHQKIILNTTNGNENENTLY